jgi:L-seryl-tRNA(Ser) seleniumtransferase
VDAILRTETAQSIRPHLGAIRLSALVRRITDEMRQEILASASHEPTQPTENGSVSSLLREAEQRLAATHLAESARRLRHVINATGVVLHTNLGRAPLSEAARQAITGQAAGYCNLEYDIVSGRRGPREGETIVSRGELVEIGGDFRVPEVMAQSGTRMVEVGTTNRTRLSDYRKAISENTRVVMRVHPSNYRVIGFTATPSLRELANLAHDAGLALYEDAGSGALIDYTEYGIDGEPVISKSIEAGADLVSFSGDKLLGGPQAGLLVGRSDLIERMRSHPLYRALRADKLRLAALEATLDSYARGASLSEVPVHQLIAQSAAEIKERAENMILRLGDRITESISLNTIDGESAAGGGSGPSSRLPTVLVSIAHQRLTPNQIEEALRRAETPVIARIVDDLVVMDLRTVFEGEEQFLELAILGLPA